MTDSTALPLLADGPVSLRALEPTDIDTILAWENDTRLWRAGSTAAPFSRRIIEEYVLTYDANPFTAGQLRLMIDYEGRPAGAIDLFEFDPVNSRSGIGVVVDEAFRHKGIGKKAIAIVARYCAERLAIHQLWAIVGVDNEGSRHMLESSGFKSSGRLRSWIRARNSYTDAYFYQLLL